MASTARGFDQIQHTPLLHHHPATEGKAYSVTAPFGREEWHEKRLSVFSGNGNAIVPDIQINPKSAEVFLMRNIWT